VLERKQLSLGILDIFGGACMWDPGAWLCLRAASPPPWSPQLREYDWRY